MQSLRRFGEIRSDITVIQSRAHQRPKDRQSPERYPQLFLVVHTGDAIEGAKPQTVGPSPPLDSVPGAIGFSAALHETNPSL